MCLAFLALTSAPASGQFSASVSIEVELEALEAERELLGLEMAQHDRELELLLGEGGSISESTNPAVHAISAEVVRIKRRIIKISEREVQLLQQKIAEARAVDAAGKGGQQTTEGRTESYPTRPEEDSVDRLQDMLTQYYAELEEVLVDLPDPEEQSRQEASARDAATLARVPFSADKVRLSTAEGNTALAEISERLSDDSIPESRRDVALICSVRTRVDGNLVSSANRSLHPVGKNHFVARVRLSPGDTELRVRRNTWMVRLPPEIEASEFLITLYVPQDSAPQLHVMAIAELLAQDAFDAPDWLSSVIDLDG